MITLLLRWICNIGFVCFCRCSCCCFFFPKFQETITKRKNDGSHTSIGWPRTLRTCKLRTLRTWTLRALRTCFMWACDEALPPSAGCGNVSCEHGRAGGLAASCYINRRQSLSWVAVGLWLLRTCKLRTLRTCKLRTLRTCKLQLKQHIN